MGRILICHRWFEHRVVGGCSTLNLLRFQTELRYAIHDSHFIPEEFN